MIDNRISFEGGVDFKKTNSLRIGSAATSSFLNQYMIIINIGQGSFGKVKLCLDLNTSQFVAIKLVEKIG